MNMYRFAPKSRDVNTENAELAATLRQLACEVERDQVQTLVITVIRLDGTVERLGNVPTISKIS